MAVARPERKQVDRFFSKFSLGRHRQSNRWSSSLFRLSSVSHSHSSSARQQASVGLGKMEPDRKMMIVAPPPLTTVGLSPADWVAIAWFKMQVRLHRGEGPCVSEGWGHDIPLGTSSEFQPNNDSP